MSSASRPWLTALDAARLLGVSRATLYAYVSRGYIRSQASSGSTRERSYAGEDVERLRRRAEERRAPGNAAARALQWGLPILESSIALIDGHTLYYRGLDAAVLARSRSLEEVAALIWTGHVDPSGARPGLAAGALPRFRLPFVARAQTLLAAAAVHDRSALDLRGPSVARTGSRILQILTRAASRSAAAGTAAHRALAREWKVDARGAEVLRAALVLCADHELNVSSFAARCVASAGSHPYAVVIAGLAALEGAKHGGASARAEAMIASMRRTRSLGSAVTDRLRRGESIDGFGHPLYPSGDPRARLLLDLLAERYAKSADQRFVGEFVRAATEAAGEHPNVDFALAAAARILALPSGSPLVLFAIGRSVGWIGHAIEQYATGQLIRPRARYVGVPPSTPAR